AVYTAGVVLPTPLACCRYYHRSLNPKKLIEPSGEPHDHGENNEALQATRQHQQRQVYGLVLCETLVCRGFACAETPVTCHSFLIEAPLAPLTPGVVNELAATPEDVPSAHALLSKYLEQFKLAPQLSEDEFAHWLLPREGVVDSFVVKDKDGKVT
ncbi:unnamed protein product, partial [Ectocarpus sp. 12 AP-2014]